MHRFVQPAPDLPDPYRGDRMLGSWLDRLLGADGHAAAAPALAALAADVTGPLRDAHRDAEAHPPTLTRYDAWGARVDRVDTAPGWETLRRAAARHRLVGHPRRTVQHALLHLYGPESATFTCPVAMADGAAALLAHPDVDTAVRDTWLPRLTSTDPDVAVTSGQWMTESQGGSDVSRTATVAVRDGDTWRLTGEKWFCSAIDSAIAVALARPDGAGAGSRDLVPFLVRRDDPGIRLHRLKDKLGTRAVPTAEVGLHGVAAVPLGDPAAPGLGRMMTLVVVTRLHNAAAAAAGMRRGLRYATGYAEQRQVAGGRLVDNPLHRATLATLAVDTAGAFALAAHAFALLSAAEAGDAGAATELRLVAPLAKLSTGRLAVAAASEYLECFGGAGYVEDTGIPRLLRDAQVLPIWEGTTNVLSVDVLRGLDAAKTVLARVPDRYRDRLAGRVDAALAAPRSADVLAGARGLAVRLGYALAAGLLDEHAGWSDDPADAALAALWTRRHLDGDDIAVDAGRQFPVLV